MNRQDKTIILSASLVCALIFASPALQRILVFPQTEFYTELWLLGPGQKAEGYPYNITGGVSYNVFLGISNHLTHCEYYLVQVKFRNLTQSGPVSSDHSYSSLASLYNLNLFVADKQSWEIPVNFSFDYSYDSVSSTVYFINLVFNGETLNLRGFSATWDSIKAGFFGILFFELWVYNDSTGVFQYDNRYVGLKFNVQV